MTAGVANTWENVKTQDEMEASENSIKLWNNIKNKQVCLFAYFISISLSNEVWNS